MKKIDLSIIIVTYNVKKLLIDCLKSIDQNNDKLTKEIFIVDNGDDDTYKFFDIICNYYYR